MENATLTPLQGGMGWGEHISPFENAATLPLYPGDTPETIALRHDESVDPELVRQLKAQGLSLRAIADRIGLSKSSVQRLVAKG
mgnify:CR=1 FL=1